MMAKDGAILSGAKGDVFERLLACNMDPGALRPYRKRNGKVVVSLKTKKKDQDGNPIRKEVLLPNVDTTLTRDVWEMFDQTVIDISRPILSAWNDLRASASLSLTDGLGTIMLTQQRRGDITPATRSMDGLRKGEADQPEYDQISTPMPITHKDFHFSSRDIAVSARGGSPLDLTNVEMASYWVAHAVEEATIGLVTPFEYGGASVYGYKTFPDRLTYTLTSPLAGGWTPDTTRNEVLEMIKVLFDAFKYGPFDLMYGNDWMVPMGKRYSSDDSRSLLTVLQSDIQKINSITHHPMLSGFDLILRERNGMTARAVIGMDIQTVQWEVEGGMKKMFKVLCILNPQLRSDQNGNTGILVATTP
jgi:uncharacterized linocin/CFP29 family protein